MKEFLLNLRDKLDFDESLERLVEELKELIIKIPRILEKEKPIIYPQFNPSMSPYNKAHIIRSDKEKDYG